MRLHIALRFAPRMAFCRMTLSDHSPFSIHHSTFEARPRRGGADSRQCSSSPTQVKRTPPGRDLLRQVW